MPLDDKSKNRVTKLFSDIERIANEPHSADAERGDSPAHQLLSYNTESNREIEALNARILELEAKLKESEQRASIQTIRLVNTDEVEARPASPIIYEKEKVGYSYKDNELSLLPVNAIEPSKTESGINTPLIASGEMIGEMQIAPPSERSWTIGEMELANAVARQASLQIQNLRLLEATERARAEAQDATRQFTHQSWESFMDGIHQSERIGFAYDQSSVELYSEPSPSEHDLLETVNVMDEHVGNLFLKADPTHPLTSEDKALVSAVGRQLGQQVENLRLLAAASRARADAEEATRRLMHESWQSFTNEHGDAAMGFMYDSVKVTPVQESTLPQDITFVQPLSVRGEVIGQLAVAGWKKSSPEALELANSIAEQVSIHIENLRLFEQNENEPVSWVQWPP